MNPREKHLNYINASKQALNQLKELREKTDNKIVKNDLFFIIRRYKKDIDILIKNYEERYN